MREAMQSFFITGTDTGVGKTFVSAALLDALLAKGISAIPMKPVQTGAKNRRAPDIDFVLKMANLKVSKELYSFLAPYIFKLPASPHLAAELEGKQIDIKKIMMCFNLLGKQYQTVLVEGAGGIMVPITRRYFMINLIKEMEMPVILVARAGLGTLNHTLLSYKALKKEKIAISCIVLNMAKGGKIEENNLKTIQLLTNCKVIKMNFCKDKSKFKVHLEHSGKKLLDYIFI